MRVALVTASLDPAQGGPSRNVPRLAEALRQAGVEAQVHAPEAGTSGLARRIGRSPELERRLLASGVNLIHAHGLWMMPLGYACRAAREGAVPLIISPRGMLAPWALRRSRWKKALAQRFLHPGAFERASGWHATSKKEADDIRRQGFRQPVCVAPNGIDPPTERSEDVRSTYERLAPEMAGRRVLLFYSRFHSKKRIAELIRDFALLAERRAAWHLLVVGIPGEYSVEQLRAHASACGVSGRVSIHDGRGLPPPYGVAELMALPTHDENFAQVVVESLVRGVPVLTTTGTPWEDLPVVGAGGWVDIERFTDELGQWMGKPTSELRIAGERGRSWALARFTWESVAAELVAFYRALIQAAALAS